jgi:hypothetical protein
MEWQPIETAPKDAVIDLWHVTYGRMCDTWWDDNAWVVTGETEGFTHWMQVEAPNVKLSSRPTQNDEVKQ